MKIKLLETNNEHKKMLELFKIGDSAGLESFIKDVHWNIDKVELIPL